MKKKVVIAVTFLLVFALMIGGCGGGSKGTDTPAPSPAPVASEPASPAPEPDEPTGGGNTEWRQFLKDYEAWVDDYVALMEKYNEDPENLELLNESVALAMDALEWANRADELEDDIPLEDISEYLETLSRILQKIYDVEF